MKYIKAVAILIEFGFCVDAKMYQTFVDKLSIVCLVKLILHR